MQTDLIPLFVLSGGSSSGQKAGLLLLLGLRTVLVEQFEKLSRRVLVESVGELSNGRRNLQTLMQDNLLTLQANVFRPFDETSQVSSRTNVLA